MKIITYFKTLFETIATWFEKKGLENAGWLVAFVVIYVAKGLPKVEILLAAALVFLGIFIEKNRKSLVDIFKELKAKAVEKLEK